MRKETRLAQGLGQLVPGVPFSYHKLPKDTYYICRHLLSSNHDKCINIRTTALPKNTASRNSDGWHLCRQDFIQLLWLALLSQRKRQMTSFFHFDAETSACFIRKKKSQADGFEPLSLCILVFVLAVPSCFKTICSLLMNAFLCLQHIIQQKSTRPNNKTLHTSIIKLGKQIPLALQSTLR